MRLTPAVLYWLKRFQEWDQPHFSEPVTLSLFKYIYCYENGLALPEPRQYRETLTHQMSNLSWTDYLKQIDLNKFPESNKFYPPTKRAMTEILGPARKYAEGVTYSEN